MGSFNKRFKEFSQDNFISAEELQDLAKSYSYFTTSGRPGADNNDSDEYVLNDEKNFWKKFKKQYKKAGGEKLGIAGVAGRADREKLINAYNNPKYGPPVAEGGNKDKEKNKYKGSIELLSEDDLKGTLYKPEYRDTSAIDKRYGLGEIQAEVDAIEANAAPSPALNFKKGLLKGIRSTAPKLGGLNKATQKANKKLNRLMDKASKFDAKMTFDMIPDVVQKQRKEERKQSGEIRALKKLGPSGPNYTPIEYKDSAFKGILPEPIKDGPFGFPSTSKAKGVSIKETKLHPYIMEAFGLKPKPTNGPFGAPSIFKEKDVSLKKLGPSGPNYKPTNNSLTWPEEKGPFGFPSTDIASGVSLKKASAFKGVLPTIVGPFGVPSTNQAKGVSIKETKLKPYITEPFGLKSKPTNGPFGVPSTFKAKGVSLKKNKKK